ncbi:hypothetical protein F0562_022726 [Nyssa sinensis]|uniref:Pectinesterase n=1 Tax=Nyssa sinensis TaxID=561372 RepID=A0A5J5BFQ3_9ASTE|nr:hypothetical protein F0562_022726 [Nyssa sinensis]
MDSIKSFKGYGKVDEIEEQAFRKKTRKRLIIVIVSCIVLVAAIIGVVAGTVIHKRNTDSKVVPSSSSPTSTAESLKAVCSVTQHPDSCFFSISALETSNTTNDPEELFKLSLHVILNELSKLSSLPETMMAKINDESVKNALSVCQTVFEDAIDTVNDSISSMDVNKSKKLLSPSKINDLRTWLSTTITDQETCLDALAELNSTASIALLEDVRGLIKNSTEFASNSLAIVSKILGILSKFNLPIHRRLLGTPDSEFPDWVSAGDRRLLQDSNPTAAVTVAKDGSGDVKTIKEAVLKVPKKSDSRFVIYVKSGVYEENIILDKSKWNVMIYGDGNTRTIVSGSLNFIDGTPTFSTATFAAVGKGFIAKDIGFKNTAGAEKHQAVAFRSGSDLSVFYRCSFDAFQDTLYAHSNRQFYRDCDITGTIDFIFGNAAVVFQSCNIQPRQPLPNQFVTITAQGKKEANQNTGISIQKCTMTPLDNLTAPTYLGRPWKDYSTTVIMQTDIGPFLNPSGWIEWVSNVDPPSTIFYAEYQNTGPGSSVDKRVNWAGYKPSITVDQASKYTVESFIQGSDWLPEANVVFDSSL